MDSVHLVTHSKGGLDAREYLELYYPSVSSFDVLSLTTLSTPHNGSVLADVGMAREDAMVITNAIRYPGLPDFTRALTVLFGTDPGTPDLTTGACATFNSVNVRRLPRDVTYNAMTADADNGNGVIDNPAEFPGLSAENSRLAYMAANTPNLASDLVDAFYQILRTKSSVYVRFTGEQIWHGEFTTIATIIGSNISANEWEGNDCFVKISSGLGVGSVHGLLDQAVSLTANQARDHVTVTDVRTANLLLPLLKKIEDDDGDLR